MPTEMTMRDHFAAAALTGLLSNVQRYQNEPLTRQAFEIADFMLNERERTNHDAAPAARAGTPGTGGTQEPVAWVVMDGDEAMEFCTDEEEAKGAAAHYGVTHIVPLYRSPTLTDAERKAISDAADRYAELTPESAETAATLRGLLVRFP